MRLCHCCCGCRRYVIDVDVVVSTGIDDVIGTGADAGAHVGIAVVTVVAIVVDYSCCC